MDRVDLLGLHRRNVGGDVPFRMARGNDCVGAGGAKGADSMDHRVGPSETLGPRRTWILDAWILAVSMLGQRYRYGASDAHGAMLDIRLLREKPDSVRANLARRHAPEKLRILEDAIASDLEWRHRLQELQDLRARRNAVSQQIGKLVKDKKDATAAKKEAAELPERIRVLESTVDALRAKVDDALMRIP